MKPRYLFVLLCAGHIGWAQAEIYKHTDAEGRVTYSSTPLKGSRKLDLGAPLAPSSHPARARNEVSHADFPKVDNATQKSRDGMRHQILADELAAEEKLLAEARKNLKDGEASPNTARYDEKIKALQAQVSLHEKNVAALKIELSSSK